MHMQCRLCYNSLVSKDGWGEAKKVVGQRDGKCNFPMSKIQNKCLKTQFYIFDVFTDSCEHTDRRTIYSLEQGRNWVILRGGRAGIFVLGGMK